MVNEKYFIKILLSRRYIPYFLAHKFIDGFHIVHFHITLRSYIKNIQFLAALNLNRKKTVLTI